MHRNYILYSLLAWLSKQWSADSLECHVSVLFFDYWIQMNINTTQKTITDSGDFRVDPT